MVKDIVRDEAFLSIPSEDADERDKAVINDLVDTLHANRERCVGMAANMIGVSKNVIAVELGPVSIVMINPRILKKIGEYKTKEGCLSLDGERVCVRYRDIEIEYLDRTFKKRRESYSGFVSEIIQHEMDHLKGIII